MEGATIPDVCEPPALDNCAEGAVQYVTALACGTRFRLGSSGHEQFTQAGTNAEHVCALVTLAARTSNPLFCQSSSQVASAPLCLRCWRSPSTWTGRARCPPASSPSTPCRSSTITTGCSPSTSQAITCGSVLCRCYNGFRVEVTRHVQTVLSRPRP